MFRFISMVPDAWAIAKNIENKIIFTVGCSSGSEAVGKMNVVFLLSFSFPTSCCYTH